MGLYIDGVYVARTSSATIDVLDLERIEILRGPQGTLFGRNSSAGSISFITRRPAEEFGVTVDLGAGDYSAWNAGITVDAPISDTLRTKISYAASEIDGWVENKGPNAVVGQPSEDFYGREQDGFRVALAWDPLENLSFDYSYDYADVDANPPYYQADSRDRQDDTTHVFLGNTAYRYVLPV